MCGSDADHNRLQSGCSCCGSASPLGGACPGHQRRCGLASPTQDPIWNNGRAPSGDVPQAVRFGGNPVIPVLFHLGGTQLLSINCTPPQRSHWVEGTKQCCSWKRKLLPFSEKREVERADL